MSSYTDLVNRHVQQSYLRKYLVSGETVAVTILLPKNLRDPGKESPSLSGMSFSTLVKLSIIEKLIDNLVISDKQEPEI